MNLIVCVSRNWGIGKDNHLLFRIPNDMKQFKALTTGKVVIMGRKTLESLPGGKPLADRTNIVLSRTPGFAVEGATVCNSVQDVLIEVSDYPHSDVFIIGGETIYKLFLPYCRRALITRVDAAPEADAFFPDLQEHPQWKIRQESDFMEYEGLSYQYVEYVNT
jgi:dihydrofolate reductase